MAITLEESQVRNAVGLHVLLVLRDARAARSHGLRLQMRGCRVTVARHVRQAVQMAVEDIPDLVLTDVGDLLRQLLAADPRTRQIPIVAGAMA
jgi:PleD family two-component response regulator